MNKSHSSVEGFESLFTKWLMEPLVEPTETRYTYKNLKDPRWDEQIQSLKAKVLFKQSYLLNYYFFYGNLVNSFEKLPAYSQTLSSENYASVANNLKEQISFMLESQKDLIKKYLELLNEGLYVRTSDEILQKIVGAAKKIESLLGEDNIIPENLRNFSKYKICKRLYTYVNESEGPYSVENIYLVTDILEQLFSYFPLDSSPEKRIIQALVHKYVVSFTTRKETDPPPILNFIIFGPPGVGKTHFANLLRKLINLLYFAKDPSAEEQIKWDYSSIRLNGATNLFLRGLGSSHVFDEAYSIIKNDTNVTKSILDTLVPLHSEFSGVSSIIYVMYDQSQREAFEAANPGISRRIHSELTLPPLNENQILTACLNKLSSFNISLDQFAILQLETAVEFLYKSGAFLDRNFSLVNTLVSEITTYYSSKTFASLSPLGCSDTMTLEDVQKALATTTTNLITNILPSN